MPLRRRHFGLAPWFVAVREFWANHRIFRSMCRSSRVSSRAQVVILERVRQRLALKPGTGVVVVGDGDVVILKTFTSPARTEFAQFVARAAYWSRRP
jgi:bifunctional DNA-binding transcriptional regulator/antitoxin component of YhaV-PrlF toxin-antitoxin module